MPNISSTPEFTAWMQSLKDATGKAAIINRLNRVRGGNFGDVKSVGGGVHELRVAVGPGYRVYLTNRNGDPVILLCAGDKSSQTSDIKRARKLAAAY